MFISQTIKPYLTLKHFKWRYVSNCLMTTFVNYSDIEREFKDVDSKQFTCLVNSQEDSNEIEKILSQYNYLKYTTLNVPSSLSTNQMKVLLDLDTTGSRARYLDKLYLKEMRQCMTEIDKEKQKQAKRVELTERWSKNRGKRVGILGDDQKLIYGLWHNALFTRVEETSRREYAKHRLANSAQFGQNVVFDFSYEQYMTIPEILSFTFQVSKAYHWNRLRFLEPFNLHFNNINYCGEMWKSLQKRIHQIESPARFINFSQKPIEEQFPNNRLIYIYPRAKHAFDTKYDHNAVFVLSYITMQGKPILDPKLVYNEHIEFRRLPIDDHILWNGFSKASIHLKSVMGILSDVKQGYDWRESFHRNLPANSIKSPEEVLEQDRYRLQMMKRRLGINNKPILSNIKQLLD